MHSVEENVLFLDREWLQRRYRWMIRVAIVERVSWEFDSKLGALCNYDTPNC
jgi:hypothetical protein